MTTFNGSTASSPAPATSVLAAIPRPVRYRRRSLLTMATMVDHLLRCEDVSPGETKAVERAVIAIKSALNSFVSYSSSGFRYYQGKAKIVFDAPIAVGTVTVSSGTVTPSVPFAIPSWMGMANIRIGRKSYPVVSYTSGDFFVGTELEDGTYTLAVLEQVLARLPADYRRRGSLSDSRSNYYSVDDVSPGILSGWRDYCTWSVGSSSAYTFGATTGDQRFQGELMLAIWPTYAERMELNLSYERYPASCEIHRFGTGTVSVTGTTVTASGSVFTADHVGSVIAVATSNSAEMPLPLADRSLVAGERIITAVTSGTVATIDYAISASTLSTRTYYITDVVDVMLGPQSEAFLRLCEYEMGRQSKSKFADKRFAEFMGQINIAMYDDARYRPSVDDVPQISGYGIGEVDGRPG